MAAVLTIALLPISARAAEPEPRAVALREVVALALAHNPTLGAAVADVDYARANVTAARGLDDFVLDVSGTWNETRRPLVSGTPVQQRDLDDVQLSAQLTRPLPTGGKIGLRLTTGFNHTVFAIENIDMSTGASSFDLSTSNTWSPVLQLTFSHP